MKKKRLLIITAILLFIAVMIAGVNKRRNDLAAGLIDEVNGLIQGRIEYNRVALSSFYSFPNLALRVNDIVLYRSDSLANRDTVAHVERMYIGIDLRSFFEKSYDIKEVRLEAGEVILVDKLNGLLGIEEALAPKKNQAEKDSKEAYSREERRLLLTIDSVKARDFEFVYRNNKFKDQLTLSIKKLNAGFEQRGDSTLTTVFVFTHLLEQFDRQDTSANSNRIEALVSAKAEVLVTPEWLRLMDIDIRADSVIYYARSGNLALQSARFIGDSLKFGLREKISFFDGLSLLGQLQLRGFEYGSWKVPSTEFELIVDKGNYIFSPAANRWFGKDGGGAIQLRPFSENPTFQIDYQVDDFRLEYLMASALDSLPFYGQASLEAHLITEGLTRKELFSNLNGSLTLEGKNLTLTDVDIDKFVRRFQRSQNFNLVDLGAVLIAGPVGLAATKGGSYASLALFSAGDTTIVPDFLSNTKVVNGKVVLEDVALATLETRIAAAGTIDLVEDSLNVAVHVVNNQGCSIISQEVNGSIEAPERSKVQVVKTLLGPINNLLIDIKVKNCPIVYSGKVPPPIDGKKVGKSRKIFKD